MIIIEISGGLGNQMFQYALGQKFISMGKEVKYDLSFYNDRVQTLRQFELDIFDLDCPVASNSELSRFGKGNSLKSRFKQKLGWDKEKIYEENLDLGYQPRIFELDDIYLSAALAAQPHAFLLCFNKHPAHSAFPDAAQIRLQLHDADFSVPIHQ